MEKLKSRNYRGGGAKYAHAKLDGQRVWIKNGRVFTYTPVELDLTFCVDWVTYCPVRSPCNIDDMFFDCELVFPGRPAEYVKTAIAERNPRLQIRCFSFDDEDGLYAHWGLEQVNEFLLKMRASPIPFWDGYEQHNPEWLLQHCGLDVEGFIYKEANRIDWAKWKPVKTVDCVVMSVQWGNGKLQGLLGSIRVGLYLDGSLVKVADVGGASADIETLKGLTQSFLDGCLVGQVMEVRYDRLGSRNGLRFPRFVRMRDDKKPEECTWDQL